MKFRLSFSIFILFSIASEAQSNKIEIHRDFYWPGGDSIELYKADQTNQATSSITIKSPCAIFYYFPEKLMAGDSESAAFDDYNYYMSSATAFMDSVKIKVINNPKNLIDFLVNAKTRFIFDSGKLGYFSGIIFFKPGKMPAIIDMTMIEDEYKNYFGK